MRVTLVNIFPSGTIARFLLSSYLLKAFIQANDNSEPAHEITVLDFSTKADSELIAERVEQTQPQLIGWSCYTWNIKSVAHAIGLLKNKGQFFNVLGGPEVSVDNLAELHEQTGADYAIIGEGEDRLMMLLRSLENNIVDPPLGVAQFTQRGVLYKPDSSMVDLRKIPSLYKSGIVDPRLFYNQQVFIETQRGCRHRCSYCLYHKGLPKLRYYPLENVLKELDYLVLNAKISALRFTDALFSSDLNRAKKIARHLLHLRDEQGAKLPWIYWEFTVNGVDRKFLELVSLLKTDKSINNCSTLEAKDRNQSYNEMLAGYVAVNCVGLQSLSPSALKSVKRPAVSTKKLKAFMDIVRDLNIVLKVDFILGLPGETSEDYFKGLENFLPHLRHTDHVLNIHLLKLLPGTDLERRKDKLGLACFPPPSHHVLATNKWSKKQLEHDSCLTAILFRVINSPFRESFFQYWKCGSMSLVEMLEWLWSSGKADPRLNKAKVYQPGQVDDEYWNDEIYREIPSSWLASLLTPYINGQAAK